MCTLLEGVGFKKIRQRGSHVFVAHPDGRTIVVPGHRGEDLGRGLIRTILGEADISLEAYLKLRR
ncbi:MAG: type II toxin-antitoxin system HicA family toxin [Deltaproteobacteria bacterium]|nr:type II toxin-antitoxin system HicA family toxin [Deltaproteobacteria bacterium]